MTSIREQILDQLLVDLKRIKTSNGYNITISAVYDEIKLLSDVDSTDPVCCIWFENETIRETVNQKPSESKNIHDCEVELICIVHINSDIDPDNKGNLSRLAEKVVQDLKYFFNQHPSITKNHPDAVVDFDAINRSLPKHVGGIKKWFIQRVASRFDQSQTDNRQTVAVSVFIQYLETNQS